MTKITVYLKNPSYADWDDSIVSYVKENPDEVTKRLRSKNYELEDGYWIDKEDPEDPSWLTLESFKVDNLDDVI